MSSPPMVTIGRINNHRVRSLSHIDHVCTRPTDYTHGRQAGRQPRGRPGLEAPPLSNGGPMVVELLLGDPPGLEGLQARQDGPPDPCRVSSLHGSAVCDHLDLDAAAQAVVGVEALGHAVGHAGEEGGAARADDARQQLQRDIGVASVEAVHHHLRHTLIVAEPGLLSATAGGCVVGLLFGRDDDVGAEEPLGDGVGADCPGGDLCAVRQDVGRLLGSHGQLVEADIHGIGAGHGLVLRDSTHALLDEPQRVVARLPVVAGVHPAGVLRLVLECHSAVFGQALEAEVGEGVDALLLEQQPQLLVEEVATNRGILDAVGQDEAVQHRRYRRAGGAHVDDQRSGSA
mmetsp:Transcript_22826/g.65323  ORF Transcript_22826/g.65323 Transcript_22826/m.65323 type:complete len:344 (-) Transcript_22826:597-1628(-)